MHIDKVLLGAVLHAVREIFFLFCEIPYDLQCSCRSPLWKVKGGKNLLRSMF